ncbi:lamin tail domain-containing protein [Streptomyces sp. NPDC048514]|uniref:lamin tail domain-containing protein n=1 Tax=Streptomyces sp. NPDC048514 TaxID=3365564 RepID=UPI003711C00A
MAAAVVGTVALPAVAADHSPRAHRSTVHISGVAAHSGRGDHSNRALNKEWVAVTNDSRRAVSLDGWTLSDKDGHTYTFHHYRLDGRSTVRVHTGMGRDTGEDLYQDRRKSVWDHNDRATLRNDHGRFVDDASWGRRHG